MTAVDEGYDIHSIIGNGSYGQVIKAKRRASGKFVAIKLIPRVKQSEYHTVKIIREISIMQQLSMIYQNTQKYFFSPQLLNLFVPKNQNTAETLENIFLVMTISSHSLYDLVQFVVTQGMSEKHLKVIFYNVLCCVKFLHSANILHRDIKPANILINDNCQVMLCDFGLSRSMPRSATSRQSVNSKKVRDAAFKLE